MSGPRDEEDSWASSLSLYGVSPSSVDSDGQLEGAFDERTIGVLVIDESLTVIECIETGDELAELLTDPVGRPLPVLHSVLTDRATDAVKQAFETGEAVEFEITNGSEGRFAVCALPVEEFVVLHVRDVSNLLRLSRKLKQTRKTLDTLEDGIYILDEAFVITSINDAVTEITGYSRDELVGAHASKLAGDETLSMATEILEQLRDEGSEVGLIESSIRGADGESIPIETRFSTVEFANGDRRRVGLVRDLRERRQNEHLLRALNRAARTLLRADTEQTVCETIVDVAADIWPDAKVVAYAFDRTTSRLDPVASEGTDPTPRGLGTAEWEAFATGAPAKNSAGTSTSELIDYDESEYERSNSRPTGRVIGKSSDTSAQKETLFASLEEYGLLTVEFDSGSDPAGVVASIELLAANAVAGLGRVTREETLHRRREELSERNRRLEQAREFNDLLRQINGALVEADTLTDIATAVCEHLVGAEQIEFAWVGETYRSNEGLQPVAVAGDGSGYLDDLNVIGTDPPTEHESGPAVRALVSRMPTFVSDISTGLGDSSWRERALVRGFQSAASIPIQYNDLSYGVLSVYGNQVETFDGVFGDLLADLGETVGNAINSLETKRSLHSGTHVELKLRIVDPDVLSSRLSAVLDEPVEVEGIVLGDADQSIVYLRTQGNPEGLASSVLAVESVDGLGEEDDATAAVTVTDRTLFARLVDYGATVESFRAESDTVETTVVIPRSGDVRQLVEALDKHYNTVELVSRREKSLSDDGNRAFSTAVGDQLTDRQYEVVRAAYLSGYFDWPRASTGEEVAETLDITQPTFNRHLRTTERKLFSTLFGDRQ